MVSQLVGQATTNDLNFLETFSETVEEIPIITRYVDFWQLNPEQTNLVLATNFSIVAGVLVAIGTALAITLGEWIRGRSLH